MPAQDEAALDFLRQLEQSVSLAPATDAEAMVSGPFRAFFSPFTAEPQLNYAMPVALPEAPDGFVEALAALRQLFASRQRLLRLEFNEDLWPALPQAVQQAGLELVEREPLMICRPAEFQPAPLSDSSVVLLTSEASDETLIGFARLRAEVFDDAPPPSAASLLRLRQAVQADHDWYALATLDGRFVGSGRCDASANGWGEITAIVTHPAFLRRGVAAAVTSLLVRHLIDSGGTLAWLSAANPTAQRVYARLGFRIVGSLLNYEDRSA